MNAELALLPLQEPPRQPGRRAPGCLLASGMLGIVWAEDVVGEDRLGIDAVLDLPSQWSGMMLGLSYSLIEIKKI